MHNRLAPQLVLEPRIEMRPLITPRLRRAHDPDAPRPDAPRPEVAAEAPPWRERRATVAARRRGAR